MPLWSKKAKREKDLVCGMEVDPGKAQSVQHEGGTYYFCSPSCKASFMKEPAKYVATGAPRGSRMEPPGMHH